MNDHIIELTFRFLLYVFFGFSMEVVLSVVGLNITNGFRINRRCSPKYLEGFVSLYMIPIHGLVMLFGFEFLNLQISSLHIGLRYAIWCIAISTTEALGGFLYDKFLGFYPWDYYADSPYRVFKRGYTLWTLVPQWGIAGLVLEQWSRLLIYLSPHVHNFYR